MLPTYCGNDTSFEFQFLEDVEGLGDQTFDIPPIDFGSYSTELSSIHGTSVDMPDSAALILPMDATTDIDLSDLDNFDFTSSRMPIAKAMFSSTSSRLSSGESTSSPTSYGNLQNAKPRHLNSCNSANCHLEVEECIPVSCRAPMTTSFNPTSKRTSVSASSDSKGSSLKNSFPPRAKSRKQSTEVEGPHDGTQGTRRSRTAHSIIERKYRDNLSSKMTQLQQTLVVTGSFSQEDSKSSDEAPALHVAKPRKSDILASTIDYIQHAEIDKRHMSEEIRLLRSQISAVKRVNRCEECSVVAQLRALQLQVPIQI